MTPMFGIVGWKNSGKTTMTASLARELVARGYRVSTIKHAHHSFDIDHEGTDSHTHRLAGASEVAIVSGARWALMHENAPGEDEPSLADVAARLSPCDIILVEGYKAEAHPKIEMRRDTAKDTAPLWRRDEAIVAIAGNMAANPDEAHLPHFAAEDISGIADFVERLCAMKRRVA